MSEMGRGLADKGLRAESCGEEAVDKDLQTETCGQEFRTGGMRRGKMRVFSAFMPEKQAGGVFAAR